MSELLAAYRRYRDLGFSPIPLAERAKTPMVRWQEFQSRLPTDDEIDEWVRRWPRANVGLVMGGTRHFAVDIDGDFDAAIYALEAKGVPLLPIYPTQITAKGKHIVLGTDRPIADAVAWLKGPGFQVDIRGPGYIAVEPSVHPSGFAYRWEIPLTDPPLAPKRLLEIAERKPERSLFVPESHRPEWVAELLANGAGEGERNQQATKLGGYLLSVMPPDVATEVLGMFAERCTPPLAQREVQTIMRSLSRRAGPPLAPSPDELRIEVKDVSAAKSAGGIAVGTLAAVERTTAFMPFPFSKLNGLLYGGMTSDEYCILGGIPSIGKTAIMLQTAENAASQGLRVLIVTLEMTAEALAKRIVGRMSGLDAGKIRAGGLAGDDLARYTSAARRLQELPIVIESGLSRADQVFEFVAAAGRDGLGYDAVILDYLQLLKPIQAKRDQHRLEIDESSETLKSIAKRLRVPTIAISSLSRNGELKESGGLDFQADIILALTRNEFAIGEIDVRVRKARSAQIGEFKLYFDGGSQTFSETMARETVVPF